MIPAPEVDGRRVESFVSELRRFAPHYTPDLNLSDAQGAGVALMRIFAQLAETIAVRLDQSPQKNFVAFLDRLGISLLPARAARVPVTFRLAAALKEAVTVPNGTRVTAPGEEDDIPFETTGSLVAIPGTLAAAYGVDPSQDFIFQPPLDFLKQEPRTPSELKYTIQSFVPAESNRLQLDHTTELEPGSFVLIGRKEKAVILKKDDGGFVTLLNPLTESFQAETIVIPIRDFEVFNGIDIQEHVLYLGHDGMFTVKENIEIKLEIELNDGQTTTAFSPLNLVWQFWTKNDDAIPEEEEHWKDLEIKTDQTNGLSQSGNVVLVKPADLEIKPREVGGVQSRWIRAKLNDRLPVPGPALPEIETIGVGVNTLVGPTQTPIGIPADQGFYNATPLDVQVDPTVGFFPFGAEPRQFDQFYIASEEAFSKRDAKIQLKFQLDLQTLAEPSVIFVGGDFRSYSIGLRRRLYEFDVKNNRWQILGSPSDNQASTFSPLAGSVPSAVPNGNEIYVFVNTSETRAGQTAANKIWVNSHSVGQATGTWTDLAAPDVDNKEIPFGPTAINTTGWAHLSRVFIVGSDGMLYSRGYPNGASWDPHGSPGQGIKLTSPPFLVAARSKLFIFINGVEPGDPKQFVYWLTLDNNLTAQWKSLKPDQSPPSFTAKYRPFAQSYVDVNGVDQAKVFTFAFLDEADKTSGRLFETDTKDESNGESPWEDLGQPTAAEVSDDETYAPHGFLEKPAELKHLEGKHIFIRGADDKFYERLDGRLANQPQWELRSRLNDPNLRGNPNIAVDPNQVPIQIHAFSASGSNSLLRWVSEIRTGTVPPTPGGQAVLLDPALSSDRHNDPLYLNKDLRIRAGTGQGQTRQIDAYDGKHALPHLTTQLTTLPDATSDCVIDGTHEVGFARPGADRLFAIHAPMGTLNATAIYIRINNDFPDIDSYSRVTGVVTMNPADINPGDNYTLYSVLTELTTESLSPDDTGAAPELSWEFWNGRGWLSIRRIVDNTRNLLTEGSVTFNVPSDIESTEVAGQENYWIRARLVGGDYGRETFRVEGDPPTQTVVSDKSSLRPPKVRELKIFYTANPVAPEVCLTFNNLNYLDQTAAAETQDSHFPPFERLEDDSLTIFFGFDQTFKSGPVRLLLDAVERNIDETRPPEFEWQFRRDRNWKKLDAEDGTVALTRQEILTISASDELTRETRFGKSLFWIKGSFRKDRNVTEAEYPKPLLRGIFLNTVWANQGQTITDEIVGSGDGEENQIHSLQHADVLEGQDIRIQEPLSAEERERIQRQLGEDAVKDREDIGGTWVRWEEVKALFDRGPQDRCYEIDRASGTLKFGDGRHGSIPIAGIDNIRAFTYRTGGGLLGNVETNKIEALATAVEGVESVFNPTPAGGGSDKADTTDMLTIGPRQISHRDRAVSVEDFEELASEASQQVAKVRCLRSTNLIRSGNGRPDPCDPRQLHEALRQRGSVSLIIVPDSTDPRPCPSLALRREVKKYLRDRAPSILAASERIVVRPPDYVIVKIRADIFVSTLEKAADVETQALTRLNDFLHPVHGGPDGKGWEFGRPISKSDVFAVLERIADVDRVEKLEFHFRDKTDLDRVVVGPNELIASGDHQLLIKKA